MMQQVLLIGSGIGATLPADIEIRDSEVGTSATASFTLNTSGAYSSVGNASSVSGTWALGGTGPAYDFRLTVSVGTFAGSATGSWINGSATATWSRTQASVGDSSAEGVLEIRNATTLQVLTTANLTLIAEYF